MSESGSVMRGWGVFLVIVGLVVFVIMGFAPVDLATAFWQVASVIFLSGIVLISSASIVRAINLNGATGTDARQTAAADANAVPEERPFKSDFWKNRGQVS